MKTVAIDEALRDATAKLQAMLSDPRTRLPGRCRNCGAKVVWEGVAWLDPVDFALVPEPDYSDLGARQHRCWRAKAEATRQAVQASQAANAADAIDLRLVHDGVAVSRLTVYGTSGHVRRDADGHTWMAEVLRVPR